MSEKKAVRLELNLNVEDPMVVVDDARPDNRPLILLVSRTTHDHLKRHPTILNQYKCSSFHGVMPKEVLAAYFEVEYYIVVEEFKFFKKLFGKHYACLMDYEPVPEDKYVEYDMRDLEVSYAKGAVKTLVKHFEDSGKKVSGWGVRVKDRGVMEVSVDLEIPESKSRKEQGKEFIEAHVVTLLPKLFPED